MAKFLLCVLVFALCFVSTQSRPIFIGSRKVYNVVDYGAVGDGLVDDTKVRLMDFAYEVYDMVNYVLLYCIFVTFSCAYPCSFLLLEGLYGCLESYMQIFNVFSHHACSSRDDFFAPTLELQWQLQIQ